MRIPWVGHSCNLLALSILPLLARTALGNDLWPPYNLYINDLRVPENGPPTFIHVLRTSIQKRLSLPTYGRRYLIFLSAFQDPSKILLLHPISIIVIFFHSFQFHSFNNITLLRFDCQSGKQYLYGNREEKKNEEKDRLNILFSLVHLSRPAARQRERVQGKEKKSLEAKPAIYDLDLRSVLWKMRTRIELPPQFMREFLRGRICRVFQSAADLPERTCIENFTPSIRRLHVYKV